MSSSEWEEPHEDERPFVEALRQLAEDTPVSPDFCTRVLAAARQATPTPDAAETSAAPGAAWRRHRFRLPYGLRPVSVLAAGLCLSLAMHGWLTVRWQARHADLTRQLAALQAQVQREAQGQVQREAALVHQRWQDVQHQLALQHQAFTLITAPEVRPVVLRSDKADSRARGLLLLKPDDPHAVLIVQDLPPLPRDRAYQLWLGWGDRQRDNGGVFRVDAQGFGLVHITAPQPFATYQRVGITEEPAGGSPGPTSPRVIGGTP